ncbi:hypothetical protein QBC34DRAFT_114790 [Podospora aff. communis PSN243]|uniref:Uncharacterized protein n=1 Tax=Podospora aff. communis PSN243 TaxID=3040156 RepID=A0AAV9GLL1_9PEZI|nr:hypothetical protein QBC34DRAFT_114790 [Podospora aff. communis PSN243]
MPPALPQRALTERCLARALQPRPCNPASARLPALSRILAVCTVALLQVTQVQLLSVGASARMISQNRRSCRNLDPLLTSPDWAAVSSVRRRTVRRSNMWQPSLLEIGLVRYAGTAAAQHRSPNPRDVDLSADIKSKHNTDLSPPWLASRITESLDGDNISGKSTPDPRHSLEYRLHHPTDELRSHNAPSSFWINECADTAGTPLIPNIDHIYCPTDLRHFGENTGTCCSLTSVDALR